MDQAPSFSSFIYVALSISVVLAVAMFAAAVLGPWGIGWLYGRFIGRLVPEPARPDTMAAELAAQIGKQGIAKRLMTPSGQVLIEGRSYEAVSEGPAIEAGQAVVIAKATNRQLVVRAVAG